MRLSALPNRRRLLAAAPALAVVGRAAAAAPDIAPPNFAAIERASGGKLGVFVIDTGSGRTFGWRADERFPFCSSFKALLAAFVLSKVDQGGLRLTQPVRYGAGDLLSYYAPVTRQHLADGAMSLEALCAAAVSYSDNTAANLLLRETGGPEALTAWMRAMGDGAFNLAHSEPNLNLSRLGDGQDTTTPRAMASSLRRLGLGAGLSPASRALFTSWLIANTTGGQRLRAGVPPGWRVGDKTGTWNEGWFSIIDNAILWPPGRAPVVVAGFTTDVTDVGHGEAALAAVARDVCVWTLAPAHKAPAHG
jgi:beta-lactamase class A